MSALPAGAADPLHILDPEPGAGSLLWAVTLFLALLLLLWWWRRRKAQEQPAPAPPPVQVTKPIAKGVHFVDRVRERFDRSGDFRGGCYALAEALRESLAAEFEQPCPTMTSDEIRHTLGDVPEITAFELLEGFQFQRREPNQDDFHIACKVTKIAVGGELEDLVDDAADERAEHGDSS